MLGAPVCLWQPGPGFPRYTVTAAIPAPAAVPLIKPKGDILPPQFLQQLLTNIDLCLTAGHA